MDEPVFQPFDKIYRLNREVIVTEKIDGTNALVWVDDLMTTVRAGSRSKWITPEQDNHGFAKWVEANAEELKKLGPGYHYGEWWGAGVNKRYPEVKTKRFSLFNASRWNDSRPACCDVVPVLARGNAFEGAVKEAMEILARDGSKAAPGNRRPEGVVAFHVPSRMLLKVTFEKDEEPKGGK